jgi:predicted amidohydrolase
MQNTFKVACIQNNSGPDIEQNINDITQLVINARSNGAELICLPEYFCYIDNDDNRMLAHSYNEDEHPALTHFCKLAKKLNVWLLLGSLPIKISKEKVNNRSYLVNNQGTIEAKYNKLHLFDVTLSDGESYLESATVEAGNKPVLASTPWGQLGMSICYDLRFAYLYRQLAQAGANFLTIPAAFTQKTGKAHWHILVRARAIETACFVFAPCQCGEHPGQRFTYGHSLIVNPWGEILADGGEEPGIIIADINVEKVSDARKSIPALQHDRKI